jgi:hypothetical protein
MKRRKNQGSVLITVITLLMLAAMTGLALTLTLQDYSRMVAKNRDELQAFYAAEAGALEVIGWFNTRGTAISAISPSLAALFLTDSDGNYTILAAALMGGSVDVASYGSSLLPVLKDSANAPVARVTMLKILPPIQPTSPIDGLLCIVHSEGLAEKMKDEKVTDLYVAYHKLKIDGAPGAILSEAAAIGGNCKAHWGEVWSHFNIKMPNQSQTPTQTQDPWLKFRSEQSIEFPTNWGVNKWGVTYHSGTNGDIVDGTNAPCSVAPKNPSIVTDYGNEIFQNQTLKWPVYDYATLKKIAQMKGRYYGTDSAGNVYRDGIIDTAHLVNDLTQLNVKGSRDSWGTVPYDLVFIDTPTKTEPTPAMALPTLALKGSGFSWKGFYWIGASLDVSGMGQPSALPCEKPDTTFQDINIFMDGIIAVQGTYTGTGNEQIYGSLYVDRGFLGTGTPDVFYNYRLKDGFPPIASDVELIRWKYTK